MNFKKNIAYVRNMVVIGDKYKTLDDISLEIVKTDVMLRTVLDNCMKSIIMIISDMEFEDNTSLDEKKIKRSALALHYLFKFLFIFNISCEQERIIGNDKQVFDASIDDKKAGRPRVRGRKKIITGGKPWNELKKSIIGAVRKTTFQVLEATLSLTSNTSASSVQPSVLQPSVLQPSVLQPSVLLADKALEQKLRGEVDKIEELMLSNASAFSDALMNEDDTSVMDVFTTCTIGLCMSSVDFNFINIFLNKHLPQSLSLQNVLIGARLINDISILIAGDCKLGEDGASCARRYLADHKSVQTCKEKVDFGVGNKQIDEKLNELGILGCRGLKKIMQPLDEMSLEGLSLEALSLESLSLSPDFYERLSPSGKKKISGLLDNDDLTPDQYTMFFQDLIKNEDTERRNTESMRKHVKIGAAAITSLSFLMTALMKRKSRLSKAKDRIKLIQEFGFEKISDIERSELTDDEKNEFIKALERTKEQLEQRRDTAMRNAGSVIIAGIAGGIAGAAGGIAGAAGGFVLGSNIMRMWVTTDKPPTAIEVLESTYRQRHPQQTPRYHDNDKIPESTTLRQRKTSPQSPPPPPQSPPPPTHKIKSDGGSKRHKGYRLSKKLYITKRHKANISFRNKTRSKKY
jgi:hypothetical protein